MAKLSELLASADLGNDLVAVDAPELGEGAQVHFRQRLAVRDILALPPEYPFLSPFAQSVFLFRLLAREADGGAWNVDEKEYENADGAVLHRIVTRAGLREKMLDALTLPRDEEADKAAGKPRSR